ncbi:MAG: hypothetical protein WCC17_17340 [Candidatus Nitrosopolaris sp.]
MIQILVPKDDIEWTSAYISDRLYLEMCSTDKKAVIYEGTDKEEKINTYYAQEDTYATSIDVIPLLIQKLLVMRI